MRGLNWRSHQSEVSNLDSRLVYWNMCFAQMPLPSLSYTCLNFSLYNLTWAEDTLNISISLILMLCADFLIRLKRLLSSFLLPASLSLCFLSLLVHLSSFPFLFCEEQQWMTSHNRWSTRPLSLSLSLSSTLASLLQDALLSQWNRERKRKRRREREKLHRLSFESYYRQAAPNPHFVGWEQPVNTSGWPTRLTLRFAPHW